LTKRPLSSDPLEIVKTGFASGEKPVKRSRAEIDSREIHIKELFYD
jgi:hypothetical protein